MNARLILSIALLSTASLAPAAPGDKVLAGEILDRADMKRGICVVLGRDGDLALELARASELLVHVRDPEAKAVSELRAQADEAGFAIQRLLAEEGDLARLPHADNTADLVLCTRTTGELMKELPVREVLRALRPGGVAILGGKRAGTEQDLHTWGAAAEVDDLETWADNRGTWLQFTKPALEGVDDWSHWEKSPDNNPVSTDAVIKAPYMTQFMAKPYYIGMPAVTTVAGGRTFLAMGHIAHHEREWEMLNRLVARNGYNGIVLWERKLPDNYLVHRSAFVATEDTFYMIDGDHVLMLDAATGEEMGKLTIPGVKGAMKWIAIVDGVLYALAGQPGPGAELVKGNRALGGWSWSDLSKGYYGKRIPHGFGDTIGAYDLKAGKVLWTHQEDSLIDARGLAIRDRHFYLFCPEKHLRSLDLATGKPRWTNAKAETLELIDEAGKGLVSTPGWRTQSLVVATPDALVIQGQTRMNVIGVSTRDGKHLWTKKKITNNPNAIYIDGKIVIGVGPRGTHMVLDPITGAAEEYYDFTKRACTRLTASPDSLFTRGEGMLRFDRKAKQATVDGAVRPGCNDGAIPANGLLYLGPWACDCNLSLIGNVARCSAGDFVFDHEATSQERLERIAPHHKPAPFPVHQNDWATYRSDLARSAGTPVRVRPVRGPRWHYQPARPRIPSEATAAGGLIFSAGDDGVVRALNAADGKLRWKFTAGGVVKYPPTIAENRAYFGSGDGWAYCLEAATGKLLWRFRASPLERKIMIYGTLSSTWPVNTGVLVHEGVAYFAAGIVDHDGTYVYALDAKTGEIVWQNNSSGHLNKQQRKGVSAQGNLSMLGDRLLLAGGNVVSPASFDLKTGKCLDQARNNGHPQSNGGKFVGVLQDKFSIAGGRILYSSPRNVSTKGNFSVQPPNRGGQVLNWGGIPPAWNDQTLVVANFKFGRITALDTAKLVGHITNRAANPNAPRNRFANNLVNAMISKSEDRWQSNLGDSKSFEPVSLAVTPSTILAVAKLQDLRRARPAWSLIGLAPQNGNQQFLVELPGDPVPGGLLVDRDGRIVVTLLDGSLVCYAAPGP